MTQGIEDTVRSNFEEFLREEARELGAQFRSFPVNAQDRDAAGDVIYSNTARLTLIEFKSYEHSLKEENRKPKRKVLCDMLLTEPQMREIHDSCHLAAWHMDDTFYLNIYRHEVCNQGVFTNCAQFPRSACTRGRFTIDDYAERFLTSGSVSAELDDFETYLAWVMTETSGSEQSTVSVQARDTTQERFALIHFNSIRAAHEWLVTHKPHPRHKPIYKGPFG